MKALKLLSGHEMPILGLGTWKSKPEEVTNAVRTALECGYRHIDCAAIYRNEESVGAAITDCIKRNIVKREDIFVTSKLWCNKMRPDLVKDACKESLRNLGLDYLDLYLIHWPFAFQEGGDLFPRDKDDNVLFSDTDHLDTWKVMEELVDGGQVRSIGFSNFNRSQVQRVWDHSRIKPSVLQVEIHPYCRNAKLVDFAKSLGIQMTAYSPLGSPDSSPPTPTNPGVLKEPEVLRMAERHGKSPAQVLIRYAIDRDIIVIPKSVTADRIRQNLEVFDFSLSAEELDELNGLKVFQRTALVLWASKNRFYPFHDEY